MRNRKLLAFAVVLMAAVSCGTEDITRSGIYPENFISEEAGKQTGLWTLTNRKGMEVCITNFGGRIVSCMVPDRNGIFRDVAIGFDNIQDYKTRRNCFGATLGRYGGRIAGGRMNIDGQDIQLPLDSQGNCTHGGPDAWHFKVFDAEQLDKKTLKLTLFSPDGESAFPGNVNVEVIFRLKEDNSLAITYHATTDKKTVINMTNHAFYNLSGDFSRTAMGHFLTVDADRFVPINENLVPVGGMDSVEGTPLDFREPKMIGSVLGKSAGRMKPVDGGLDHDLVLNTEGSLGRIAASLYCPESGIQLDVMTTEPSIHLFSGNTLNGSIQLKKGIRCIHRGGVCLETQHFPDSPNQPEWPSTSLEPDKPFTSTSIYRFSVKE